MFLQEWGEGDGAGPVPGPRDKGEGRQGGSLHTEELGRGPLQDKRCRPSKRGAPVSAGQSEALSLDNDDKFGSKTSLFHAESRCVQPPRLSQVLTPPRTFVF